MARSYKKYKPVSSQKTRKKKKTARTKTIKAIGKVLSNVNRNNFMGTVKSIYNLLTLINKMFFKKKEAKKRLSPGPTRTIKRPLASRVATTPARIKRVKSIKKKGRTLHKKQIIQAKKRVIKQAKKQLDPKRFKPFPKQGFGPKFGVGPVPKPKPPKGGGGSPGGGGRVIHRTAPDNLSHVPRGYQFSKPTGPLAYQLDKSPRQALSVKLSPPAWNSSAIWMIGYNTQKKILMILFNSGDAYKYNGIELRDAQDLYDGISMARTEGYNKWGAWYRGKGKSVGAAYNYIIKPLGIRGQLVFSMAARS